MRPKNQIKDEISQAIGHGVDESRLQLALDAARMGTWERNLLTGEDVWTERQEALFGLPPGSFRATHQSFLSMVHVDDRPVIEAAAHRAIEGTSRYESEYRIYWPDGSLRWMMGRGDVIRDAAGRATNMVGITMDITERKMAEIRLATEHAVSRVLSEASTRKEAVSRILEAVCQTNGWQWASLWTVDSRQDVLRCVEVWQSSVSTYSEFERESLDRTFSRGRGLPGRVWSSGHPAWIADVSLDANFPRKNMAMRAGLRGAVAFPVVLRGEVVGVMEFFSRDVRPPDAALLAMMGSIGVQVGQFIDRMRAEQDLRESEARSMAMLESALDCIVSMDHLGKIIEWNPAAEKTFGYTRAEAVGQEMAELIIPPALRPAHRAGLARFLTTGEGPVLGKRIEITAIRKDGSEFPVELGITPILAVDPPLFTGYLREISDRKWAQEQLRVAKEQAEAASNAKDHFLAVLSHELRTPLSPVVLAAATMETHPNLPPDLREDVAMIRRNIDLETRLIDDLLDLSRVSSGKLRITPQDAGIHDLVHHVLDIVAGELQEKQLKIEADLQARCDNVKGDPARLQQVLWNLVKNAAKFSYPGGTISLRTWCEGNDYFVLEVSDHGRGIAAEALPRIFNAFEQGEATVTRTFGGLGLGLAIAKAVVDLHGGRITATSDGPGKGATFSVRLPLAPGGIKESPHPVEPGVGGDIKAIRNIRVLLVEDHADTSRILSRVLGQKGYDVQCAANVDSALKLISSDSFDVLVSDIGLPDASGYDLMRQVRPLYRCRGIAVSGYGMDEDIRKSKEAGFDEHLVKPISLDLLDRTIRRLSEERHS